MKKSFDGLILLDKPSGMTSHDVVAKARKILQTKSIGHSGTLDPLASGLLILLVGEATKLNSFIVEGEKSYEVGFKLGVQTDTLDITGKVISTHDVQVSDDVVINTAIKFIGEMSISVPIYSAVKVDGKKLYEYARNEIEVKAPVKIMSFWDAHFIRKEADCYYFQIHCSKGSYIRSWVDELGKKLGCYAVMTSLRRLSSKPYSIDKALSIDGLKTEVDEVEQNGIDTLSPAWVPMNLALPLIKKLRVQGFDLTLLLNGQISHDLRIKLIQVFDPDKDQFIQVLAVDTHRLVAIIGLEKDKGFSIKRVFKPN